MFGYKIINIILLLMVTAFLSDVKSTFVDLTHITDEETIYWPIFFPFNKTVMQRGYVDMPDGSRTWIEFNALSLPEHIGTHMDAPAHFADKPGYWRIHEIPLEHFIGPAVVIDITYKANVFTNSDASLLVEDLLRWESMYGNIPDGSIVFCYSGWDQYWHDESNFLGNDVKDTSNYHFPGFSLEAAQWLIKNRNIVGVGVDTISLDVGKNGSVNPVHVTLLSQNIYGLENVNNLGRMPASGARVYVFPNNFRDASGTPTRIIAEFESPYLVWPFGYGYLPEPSSSGSRIFSCFVLIAAVLNVILFW